MAVMNITPDSFSDGGSLYSGASIDRDLILRRADMLLNQGADLLDIGGESTRPGAAPVTLEEERERVLPVVELLVSELDALVSVDTSSAAIMTEAAALGAGMINDVRALSRDGALQAAAATDLPVCLMHMQGTPQTMQDKPSYTGVVEDVSTYLKDRVAACEAAGITRERVVLDPGFGFGKTLQHNLQLLAGLPKLAETGLPVLVGLSRKSLLGTITGREVDQRLAGSITLAALAVERGAHIVRVHDVAETRDALAVVDALRSESRHSRPC